MHILLPFGVNLVHTVSGFKYSDPFGIPALLSFVKTEDMSGGLFVLLGLPVSLLLDSVLGVSISLWRVLGVAVVACGVAGFEWAGTVRSRAGADHGAPVEAEELSSICEDSSSGQVGSLKTGRLLVSFAGIVTLY